MAASYTLTSTRFPDGTVVYANPVAARGDAPVTATMSGGSATFDGLRELEPYVAHGTVSGMYRETRFTTDGGSGSSGSGSGNGLPSTFVTKTGAYTAAVGEVVQANAVSAGFTVTLPAAPAAGALITVRKTDASTNVVTIAPSGGGTINDGSTATTSTQYAGATFEHVASNAWIVAAPLSTTGPAGADGTDGANGTNGTNGTNGLVSQVQDEGSNVTTRATWSFEGAGVAVTDTGSKNVITIGGGSGSSIGMPVFAPSGKYITAAGFSSSTVWDAAGSSGYTRLLPMPIAKAATFDRIGINVFEAGSAGAVVRLGIYAADSDGLPAALILDAGTIDATSTGYKEITISQALSAGFVFLSATPQVAGCKVYGTVATVAVLGIANAALSSAAFGGYENGGSVTGALPSPFGTPSIFSAAQAPRILLRAA